MNTNITEGLTKHVADLGVLYIKLHNYHWNLHGLQFKTIHELAESYYDFVTEQFDAVAERLVQLTGKSPATMKEFLELTGLKEEQNASYSPIEALKGMKADYEYVLNQVKKTRTIAADDNDAATDALLTDLIIEFEKQLWFMDAMLK